MNRIVHVCFSMILLLFSGCVKGNAGSQGRPEVTLYAVDSANLNLHMIFDLNNSGRLCDQTAEIVKLKALSESVNPWTGFSSGDFIISTDDKNAVVYGNYYYENVVSNQEERTIAVFKRKGTGERAIGSPVADGSILSIDAKKKISQIGQCQYMDITTPEGEKRTVNAARLINPNSDWLVPLGDKIYRILNNGVLVQAGWVDWRKIKTSEGNLLVILMTKGMGANARWAGRYDGKLYQD